MKSAASWVFQAGEENKTLGSTKSAMRLVQPVSLHISKMALTCFLGGDHPRRKPQVITWGMFGAELVGQKAIMTAA